jgi:hypothetical protein
MQQVVVLIMVGVLHLQVELVNGLVWQHVFGGGGLEITARIGHVVIWLGWWLCTMSMSMSLISLFDKQLRRHARMHVP